MSTAAASPPGATREAAAPIGGTDSAPLRLLYDNALKTLTQGDPTLALPGFQEYLRRAPDSNLADNAQYWIGECYYAQRNFQQALAEFSKVEQLYPRGNKVPASLLKAGYSQLQMSNRAGCVQTLQKLVSRYPDSSEAALARARLRSLP